MTRRRIVVGAISGDDKLYGVARALRDAGREVVLVGGGQSCEQLISAALAEDADELVVGGTQDEMARLEALRDVLGAEHIRITPAAGVTDLTRQNPV